MDAVGNLMTTAWGTPGVSEFLSVLLGGSITLGAQRWALRHDREKEAARRRDEQKGLAWSIYFKISEVNETLTRNLDDLRKARAIATASGRELWQVIQTPPHDPSVVQWRTEELVLLIDHKQFDLMERYRLATLWLSNIVQSTRTLREMRVEFLNNTPSDVQGTTGAIMMDESNRRTLMPRIAHLRMLSESMESVVQSQQPQVLQLLKDYAAAMKQMIGMAPLLDFDPQRTGRRNVGEPPSSEGQPPDPPTSAPE